MCLAPRANIMKKSVYITKVIWNKVLWLDVKSHAEICIRHHHRGREIAQLFQCGFKGQWCGGVGSLLVVVVVYLQRSGLDKRILAM